MPPDIAAYIEQSQNRETVILLLVVVCCVGYLLKIIVPFFRGRVTEKEQRKIDDIEELRQTVHIITTKDADGNYILLSFPRMFREMIAELHTVSNQLTHLVNHQSKMMEKILEDTRVLRKRVEKLEKN